MKIKGEKVVRLSRKTHDARKGFILNPIEDLECLFKLVVVMRLHANLI